MSIRFAAPPHAYGTRLAPQDAREACGIAANDNGTDQLNDPMLQAALRHFAQHGMAAARNARQQAHKAQRQGDQQAYLWWLEICRALDRRMANALDAEPRIGT
ncbi:hypothetical protein WYH_00119 [Croceibacterium atlanticum]|uniref:Uncharacterized protein n=1 Tax=Croceibacterium atlanticum TaxID=1267766 RepID=A0A0F7KQT8_9SPHN|nr:hypothetical protein [Croceibacterium atlanticum]AKH41185.1 hypothetical protein WYH_00119 [Croceibacterium atlanticum]